MLLYNIMMEQNLKKEDFSIMILLERYQGGSYKRTVFSEEKYVSFLRAVWEVSNCLLFAEQRQRSRQ
jgi:hypothetical protein